MFMKNYPRQLIEQGLRDFHIRTDIWFAVLSVAAAAFAGPGQKTVNDITVNELALYTLIAVVAFASMRLFILAPYKLWKEAQEQICSLKSIIDSPQKKQRDMALLAQENDRAEAIRKLAPLTAYPASGMAWYDAEKSLQEIHPIANQFMGERDFWMHWDLLKSLLRKGTTIRSLAENGDFHEKWHNNLNGVCSSAANHHLTCMIAILSGVGSSQVDFGLIKQFENEELRIVSDALASGYELQWPPNI